MADRKSDTWMPLYIGDYLRDTGDLSAAENGAYLLLLMHAWVRGGALPPDDERLRRLAKMDPKEWATSRDTVLGFFQRTGEELRHKRVDNELARAATSISQRSAAGKASAAKRAADRMADDKANDGLAPLPTDPQRNSIPSPSPSPEEEKIPSLRSGRDAPFELDAKAILFSEGRQFLAHVTGKSPDSLRSALGQLVKEAGGDCSVVLAAIEAAKVERPVDPIPWLRRACQQRNPGRKSTADKIGDDWGGRMTLEELDASSRRELPEDDDQAIQKRLMIQ